MSMEVVVPKAQPIIVCVTGASGFIGSWLVMKLLQRGYTVHATVRDLELPRADDASLRLFKADMNVEGSFDEAVGCCECVFHMATPMDFESNDHLQNEVIKPTVDGMLSIIRSCAKAQKVKRLIFTNSAGTLNVEEHQRPPVVVGPFIIDNWPPSLITALSPITGNEAHYSIIKQGQFVHVDDLCEAHIFLSEHPKTEERYICSSHDATIYDIANMIREKWPEYDVPTEFEGIDKDIPVVRFSSKKLMGMGFTFKYTLEDMFREAIETCRDKGLLPYSTTRNHIHGEQKIE